MEWIIAIQMGFIIALGVLYYQELRNVRKQDQYIDELEKAVVSDNNEIREQFLKFVSDSRDWAFDYIENVQQELNTIKEMLELSMTKIRAKKRKSADDGTIIAIYNRILGLLPEDK